MVGRARWYIVHAFAVGNRPITHMRCLLDSLAMPTKINSSWILRSLPNSKPSRLLLLFKATLQQPEAGNRFRCLNSFTKYIAMRGRQANCCPTTENTSCHHQESNSPTNRADVQNFKALAHTILSGLVRRSIILRRGVERLNLRRLEFESLVRVAREQQRLCQERIVTCTNKQRKQLVHLSRREAF